MCKKTFLLVAFVLMLGSIGYSEDIQWTDLGADHLWSNPDNWNLGRVPTLADDVRIDVPAAAAPNGPVIQDGIAAQANGIFTEAAGAATLTLTGGTLEVGNWIWWGDGADSFPVWEMSGGIVTVPNEFELGWGGGGGTLIITGGNISAGEAVIPTGSGAFGDLYLYGGTYNVTKPGGLSVKANGLIDITEGTLVLEGDETAKVNDLVASGRILGYGGTGKVSVDYNSTNPGKTTVTALEVVVVLSEDFEGLPLGPNVDETLVGDQVWTDTPPAGWVVDESGIPGIGDPATDGVTEWAGWAFTDKAWWTQAAEDQNRSQFTLGIGTVAVADPDEWDDADHSDSAANGWYKTYLSTPEIDISGIKPGTLQLKFDSSWRPEFDNNYHQTANITASFDGGEPVQIMLWESDGSSPNFKPDATNETVVIDLQNPEGASSVVLTFGLFDAGNDWWWAIDNVQVSGQPLPGPELVAAFAFGSRALDCATYNVPSVNYTMVLHDSVDSVKYDPARGFGYEVIYPTDSPFGDRAGYGIFGPFDDSPNNRNEYPNECPEELYDSFIGAKSFTNEVSAATMGDMDTPSPNPEGIIFRVDVPNGFYRFVGAFGEADNNHAHRILAEDGGSGPPANIGPNHVVLVHNHDQAQYDIGEAVNDLLGNGVFARVGFDGKIPPPGDGVAPSPVFVDMDENGRPTDAGPNSPILEVTQGYIRIHQLQGNSNDGPGGARDANGGDAVILELWKLEPEPAPAPKTAVYDFESGAQGWGDLKDGTATTVVSETHAGGGNQSLRATMDEAAHGQQQGGMASGRDFTVDDADISRGGYTTLSFWYRADDPDFNGKNLIFHWIMSTESWSGGGWYGNGLWGVLIADGQWHQQTVDLSILGEAAGGWQGAWGDQTAWDFRDDLLYSFEILFDPSDNTTGSYVYIDDVVFSRP